MNWRNDQEQAESAGVVVALAVVLVVITLASLCVPSQAVGATVARPPERATDTQVAKPPAASRPIASATPITPGKGAFYGPLEPIGGEGWTTSTPALARRPSGNGIKSLATQDGAKAGLSIDGAAIWRR